MNPDNTGEKQADGRVSGRFPPGASGNPRGRPRGSRNRTTVLLREMLEADGAAIVKRAIADAKRGRPVALRLVLDRLIPPITSEAAPAELPAIAQAADVAEAVRQVIASAARGELTLAEAREWLELIEHQRSAIETEDLAVRVELLEREVKERERERRR